MSTATDTLAGSQSRLRALAAAALLLCMSGCTEPAEQAPEKPWVKILGNEQKLWSQRDEELIIREFFQDRRDGYFVDIGCAWPLGGSTTAYLEMRLGWTGIGVDAVDKYGPSWAASRPNTKFLNFLVTDHSGTNDTFYRADYWGVSSNKKEMVEDKNIKFTEIKVPSITIDRILELNEVKELDFLSMDIEGAQMEALHGFDIEKWKPELVCIESYRPDRPRILAYFEDRGYERLDQYLQADVVNWYFTPRKDQ